MTDLENCSIRPNVRHFSRPCHEDFTPASLTGSALAVSFGVTAAWPGDGRVLATLMDACSSCLMRNTAVSAVDGRSIGAQSRVAMRSRNPEEASEIGGKVYYPHGLAIGGATDDFEWRLKARDLGNVTVGLLEYSTPVRLTTGDLENAYQVNFPSSAGSGCRKEIAWSWPVPPRRLFTGQCRRLPSKAGRNRPRCSD